MPDPAVPSEGGALADLTLDETEHWLRSLVGGRTYTARALAQILAEYDRLVRAERALTAHWYRDRDEMLRLRAELARSRKVVQAATALAAKWEAMRRCYQSVEESDQLGDLLDALAAEVAALSDTEGSGT